MIKETGNEKRDDYFGIVLTKNNEYVIGDKTVEVIGNDIIVDDTHYKGTAGLWSQIMFKKPDENLNDLADLDTYEKLVRQTDIMQFPNLGANSKIKRTYKWKNIFSKFDGEKGHGTEFLLKDINSV